MEERNRRNRSRFEISADVLAAAKGGARKTHIMYRANLSFNMLCRYLNLLTRNGLLTFDTSMNELYRTSEKGFAYLTNFDAYKRSEYDYADKARSLERMLHPGAWDGEERPSAESPSPNHRLNRSIEETQLYG